MDRGEQLGRRLSFLVSRAREKQERPPPKKETNDKFIFVSKHHTVNTDMGLGSYPPLVKLSALGLFIWPYSRSGRNFIREEASACIKWWTDCTSEPLWQTDETVSLPDFKPRPVTFLTQEFN